MQYGLVEALPLNFLMLVIEDPNYSFGQPIYNNTLNFYTFLIKYFISYHLNRDLFPMDRIQAEDIDCYHPLARLKISEKNFNNEMF